MSTRNIFIIGNGFDIAHKLETKYEHLFEYEYTRFVNYHEPSLFGDPNNHTYLVKKRWKDIDSSYINKLSIKNKYFLSALKDQSLNGWCDLEELYFNHLTSSKSNNYTSLVDLNNDFEKVKDALKNYLKSLKLECEIDGLKQFFESSFLTKAEKNLFVNFNYTDTISNYISNSANNRIINVHGNLDGEIVFGYGHENPSEITSGLMGIEKNTLEKIKNFKHYNYKNGTVDLDKIKNWVYLTSREVNVIFMGHSIAPCDKYLLKYLIDQRVSRIYFTCMDRNDYSHKMYNFESLFGMEYRDKIKSFKDEGLLFPQLNDISQYNLANYLSP